MGTIMRVGVVVQTGVRAIGMIMQASVNVQLSARSPRKERSARFAESCSNDVE